MKKISKNKAGFSKPMLSILLAIVLFVSNLSVRSVAEEAGADEPTSASATEAAETSTGESEAEETQDSEGGSTEELPEPQEGTGTGATDETGAGLPEGTGTGATDETGTGLPEGSETGSTEGTGAGSLGEPGVGLPEGTEMGSQEGAGTDGTTPGSETIVEGSSEGESEAASAELTEGAVTVKLDRGYDPDQYTNDEDADGKLPERTIIIHCNEGEEVSLPDLSRFGYIFMGWEVTSGKNPGTLLTEDNYTVTLDDCVTEETGNTENTEESGKAENTEETGNIENTEEAGNTENTKDTGKGEYVITMEAQWEAALDMLNASVLAAGSGMDYVLNAEADPTKTTLPSASCVLPDGMEVGELRYKLSGNQLKLVSKTEMLKHQYDSEWKTGKETYKADDTVAIELKVETNGSTVASIDLSNSGGSTGASVGGGSTLTLTLYHSKVMTTAKSYSFNIKYTFFKAGGKDGNGETINALAGQKVEGTVTVKLVASIAQDYMLKKDSTVSDNAWTITYADTNSSSTTLGDTGVDVEYGSQVTLTPGTESISITLTFKDANGNVRTESLDRLAGSPESEDGFVYPTVTENSGSYTFNMPAKNVTISSLWELYLDNGTIELSEGAFKQGVYGGNSVAWQGDYRILQCADDNSDSHSTSNVLKLYGNLRDHKISLGNLNIDEENSIELVKTGSEDKETKVTLTQEGNIQAKNILVPEGTSLTVQGLYKRDEPENEANNKSITLEPGTERSAIGADEDNPKNGSITLEKVNVAMTLEAPSVFSGIGSGGQENEDSCGKVEITDSKITVKEKSGDESGKYTGAWIGGAGVESVKIINTTLLSDGISDSGARAVDGKDVEVTDSSLGARDNRLPVPIHGKNMLVIQKTSIYQTKRKD